MNTRARRTRCPWLAATTPPALPTVGERATWQAELDALRVREKAHTHEGDAIAAARRRLPMVEIDSAITLIGPHGPITLLDAFEGRWQLLAYYHMWFTGEPAEDQCDGCIFFNGQVRELSYLHSRDVTYATFCQGPYRPCNPRADASRRSSLVLTRASCPSQRRLLSGEAVA